MSDAFDVFSFFGGSPNRLRVLRAVRDEPATRRTLQAVTGVNRVTLGRTLAALESRGWIRRAGDGYAATATGRVVAGALEGFLDTVETAARLDGLLRWLPLDEMDFDLARLADATVVSPRRSDPQATLRRAHETARAATDLAMLTHAFTPAIVDAVHQRVTAGDQTVEMVVTADALDVLAADPDLRAKMAALLDADGAAVYRFDGDVPHVLAVADETVSIGVDDDQGRAQGLLETDDPAVRDWAQATVARYREAATRLGSGDLGR
ncbi:MAG: helix-turn-helix transcriptional regulator [Halobacteriaceae archaeon]